MCNEHLENVRRTADRGILYAEQQLFKENTSATVADVCGTLVDVCQHIKTLVAQYVRESPKCSLSSE